MVHQNFLETDNQFVTAPNGNTTDRFVTAEFLPYVSYLCRLVVTNVSSTTEKLSLFMQVCVARCVVLCCEFVRVR